MKDLLILEREPEPIVRAHQRFDALAPLIVASEDCPLHQVWLRQGRLLVRRESPICWRLMWFEADGIGKIEGLVLESWLKGMGFRSVWTYADELTRLMDIFRPLICLELCHE
jgi:hypothetical protein